MIKRKNDGPFIADIRSGAPEAWFYVEDDAIEIHADPFQGEHVTIRIPITEGSPIRRRPVHRGNPLATGMAALRERVAVTGGPATLGTYKERRANVLKHGRLGALLLTHDEEQATRT